MKWLRKAAEQGHASAQYNLGVRYYFGELQFYKRLTGDPGVSEDHIKAYMWWSLAKAQGNKDAASFLDMVKEEMTPAQIAKAQALAAEWLEKHNN